MKDYYKILEVNQAASSDVISKVYKVLAKKYHPDTQTDPAKQKEAEEKFKEISEAYEILSNSEKRKTYDEELLKEQQSNTVDISKYMELAQYCKELENKINLINSQVQQTNYNTQASNQANNTTRNNYEQVKTNITQQAYQDAMKKAYNDAYYNTLRNMGYTIHYKKTFKEYLKGLLALIITFAIVTVIGFILYQIPTCRNYINGLLMF